MESGKKRYFRKEYPSAALGTLTAMSFEINENLRDFYIYSTSTENSISSVQLEYKICEGEWEQKVDERYPFEFSLRVEKSDSSVKFKWKAIDPQGFYYKSEIIELK